MTFTYKRRSKEDIERLEREVSNTNSPGVLKPGYELYKMRAGENWIRIIPNTWSPEGGSYQYPVEYHAGVGPQNATVLCLFRMKRKKCPICDASSKLIAAGDEEEGKALRARGRLFMLIVDMKEVDKGVQVLDCPKSLAEDIVKVSKDRRTGEHYDIDDPDAGYDIFFEKEGERLKTKYKGVSVARDPTRLPKKFLNWAIEHPLTEGLLWYTASEMAELYSGGQDEEEEPLPPPRRRARLDDDIPDYDEDEDAKRSPFGKGSPVLAAKPRVEEDDDDEVPPPRAQPRPRRVAVDEYEDEAEPTPPFAKIRAPVVADDEDEAPPAPRRRARAPAPDDDEELYEAPAPRRAPKVIAPPDDDDDEYVDTAPRRRVKVTAPVEDDDEVPAKKPQVVNQLRTALAKRRAQ